VQNHEEREILRIAERLAEIKPNDESTRRSIQRTRVTLQDQITRNLSRPRRTALPLRIAVGLAVVVGIVGPVAWLFSSGNESSLVFADVQKRISTTRTVTFF